MISTSEPCFQMTGAYLESFSRYSQNNSFYGNCFCGNQSKSAKKLWFYVYLVDQVTVTI